MLAPSPSQPSRPIHCGRWSLLDMLRVSAKPFLFAFGQLAAMDPKLQSLLAEGPERRVELPEGFLETMSTFRVNCENLGASVSGLVAEDIIAEINAGDGHIVIGRLVDLIRHLRDDLQREVGRNTIFVMLPEDARLFDDAISLFGDDALTAFPSTAGDIDEAGKCLALGRAPAAVFHLMRVVETAVRALGVTMGISAPNADWGAVIRALDEELKAPKNQQKLPDHKFLAGASSQMHAVKLAWRNQVMHVDTTFSLDNARDIFNATKALMQHLATKISEPSVSQAQSS